MSTFDEALATILAEHKALRRENELLKKKLADLLVCHLIMMTVDSQE